MTKIPENLRKKFCDDFKLPIKIYSEPHFSYLCELYEDHLQIKEKENLFLETYAHFNNHREKFIESWYSVKDAIFAKVSQVPAFQELIKADLNYQFKNEHSRGNPYNHGTVNKLGVSIDIRKANYSALRYYNPEIMLNTNSFEEFVELFTPLKYFQEVKIFRQLLFEPLNAKRQNTIQKKLTDDLLTFIKEDSSLESPIEIRTPSADEIILFFKGDNLAEKEQMVQDVLNKYELSTLFKVEGFVIRHLIKDMFYKQKANGEIVLRNVPYYYYPQCYKKIQGMLVHDLDLEFYFEEELAKFKKPLFK